MSEAGNAKEQEVSVRLPASAVASLDAWIANQPEPRPSRSDALRQLLAGNLDFGDAGSIPVEDLNSSNDE